MMKMLIVGAGVIGTAYVAHIAAAGNQVSVPSHGRRTDEVAAGALRAHDVFGGGRAGTEAEVVRTPTGTMTSSWWRSGVTKLASACAGLAVLAGKPAVVVCGNNPSGRAVIPSDYPAMSTSGSPASAASWPAVPPTMSELPSPHTRGTPRRRCGPWTNDGAARMFGPTISRSMREAMSPLMKRMFAAGRLGRKSGKGFYDYA
jgi:hypothetical protein